MSSEKIIEFNGGSGEFRFFSKRLGEHPALYWAVNEGQWTKVCRKYSYLTVARESSSALSLIINC